MEDSIFQAESKHLTETIVDLKDVIQDTKVYLDNLPKLIRDDEYTLSYMQHITNMKINSLEKSTLKPYFARIDYQPSDSIKTDTYYIGKVGAMDDNGHLIIIDWRAPVSTLYYDSNIGDVNYQAPDSLEYGKLKLKRQFNIEEGKLLSLNDVDTVANDDLLKPYLGVNADNRLKNIVASIQAEQNSIIRYNITKNIIIQGVAGSGKTTVALHRIAYLVYTYRDMIKNKQYMVIGPNKFFINYISAVLPDLDVNDVPELTLSEITKRYLNEKMEVNDPALKLINLIEQKQDDHLSSFKSSLSYKEALDKFIKTFETDLLMENDFHIEGYRFYRKEEIKRLYDQFEKNDSIKSKIERVIIYYGRQIQKQAANFYNNVVNQLEINNEDHDTITKKQLMWQKEIKNGCKNEFKKHFHKIDTKVMSLYKEFIKKINEYTEHKDLDLIALQNQTLNNLNLGLIDFEDIPALIYLKYRLIGSEEFSQYKHIVIDEAQDFGDFHFYILHKLFSNSTFSIFGDLAQSIYEHYGISNWEDVITNVFDNKCDKITLDRSYRTSIEIMDEANKITKFLNLNTAIPVIRHGEKVSINHISDDHINTYLLEKINSFKEKGYKSIALICKTQKEAQTIYNMVKDKIKIELINNKNEIYDGGLCILTSYLAKGLEFDAVIVCDASSNIYNVNNNLDMKLLYIAMTRPLHELEIIYKDKLVSVLDN